MDKKSIPCSEVSFIRGSTVIDIDIEKPLSIISIISTHVCIASLYIVCNCLQYMYR